MGGAPVTRAFVARALHALGTLVAGHDPAALAIAEATRASGEAARAVDLARLALTSAERAVDADAVTMEMALRTRGVVGAMLREGIGRAEAGFSPVEARPQPTTPDAAGIALRAAGGSLPAVTVARSRELLADLADAEDEPPRVAGGDD